MRIAVYEQIDTEKVKRIIHHPSIPIMEGDVTVGEESEWDEEVWEEKPIMGMTYRDATPEEEAEILRQQAEAEEMERNRPLTTEERMEILEDAFAEFVQEVLS